MPVRGKHSLSLLTSSLCRLTSPNFLREKDRQMGQREGALLWMAFHLSVSFKNRSGSWPLLLWRCPNSPWIILQHGLNSCCHLKSWDSRLKTALQVFLDVNDSPSLADNVFFFNWVSQITGCGFIDLIFFSAYNNMKYVPCEEQSSRIRYIFTNCINTLNLLLASQKHWVNNQQNNPCIHVLRNSTLNVFPPRGNRCLSSVVLHIQGSSWVYRRQKILKGLAWQAGGRSRLLISLLSPES